MNHEMSVPGTLKMINPQIYLHYNYTGKLDHRPSTGTSSGTLNTKTIVFLVICSFIALENLTVLIAIWKNHRFHNRMYFFIGNLALCDLLAGVAYLSSSRKVSKHSNSEHAMSLLRTVIIVVGVFIACWTPIFVLLLVDVACEQRRRCSILYKADWFIALAVLNSAMNPIIYTLASREMRRAFLGLVCGSLYKGKASINGSGARPSLEPSRSRSKSWSSQNNPNQNQPSSRQAELDVAVDGNSAPSAGTWW
uniref:Sphingosine-1-phosphate receptor 3 n=1 Tax=Myripristis murdjan TaxID=586833 RepID=A0A667YQC3_9TELE